MYNKKEIACKLEQLELIYMKIGSRMRESEIRRGREKRDKDAVVSFRKRDSIATHNK